MTTTPARRDQRQPARRDEAPSLVDMIGGMKGEIAKCLPETASPERVARLALTAIRITPKLAESTPASFFGALLSAATLGLDVNTPLGHAYLIPFNRKVKGPNGSSGWVTECQLIVGYRGMIELGRRSGVVTKTKATVVRAGDEFFVEEGCAPVLRHRPSLAADRHTAPMSFVYAVAHLVTGGEVFQWLSRGDVEARRQRSRAKDSGPWVTDYQAMAMKTAVRALFPWLPQSAEMQTLATAVALDHAADRGVQAAAYPAPVIDVLDRAGLELPPTSVDDVDDRDGSPDDGPPPDDFGDLLDGDPPARR